MIPQRLLQLCIFLYLFCCALSSQDTLVESDEVTSKVEFTQVSILLFAVPSLLNSFGKDNLAVTSQVFLKSSLDVYPTEVEELDVVVTSQDLDGRRTVVGDSTLVVLQVDMQVFVQYRTDDDDPAAMEERVREVFINNWMELRALLKVVDPVFYQHVDTIQLLSEPSNADSPGDAAEGAAISSQTMLVFAVVGMGILSAVAALGTLMLGSRQKTLSTTFQTEATMTTPSDIVSSKDSDSEANLEAGDSVISYGSEDFTLAHSNSGVQLVFSNDKLYAVAKSQSPNGNSTEMTNCEDKYILVARSADSDNSNLVNGGTQRAQSKEFFEVAKSTSAGSVDNNDKGTNGGTQRAYTKDKFLVTAKSQSDDSVNNNDKLMDPGIQRVYSNDKFLVVAKSQSVDSANSPVNLVNSTPLNGLRAKKYCAEDRLQRRLSEIRRTLETDPEIVYPGREQVYITDIHRVSSEPAACDGDGVNPRDHDEPKRRRFYLLETKEPVRGSDDHVSFRESFPTNPAQARQPVPSISARRVDHDACSLSTLTGAMSLLSDYKELDDSLRSSPRKTETSKAHDTLEPTVAGDFGSIANSATCANKKGGK